METREILWNVGSFSRIALNVLMVLPFIAIAFGLARRVRSWRRGLPEDRFGDWGTRLRSALVKSVFHGRIVRRNKLYAGIMHANIFGGFIILLIGTIIVAIEDDIAVPLLGTSFYHGTFYLGLQAGREHRRRDADCRRPDVVLPALRDPAKDSGDGG